VSGRLFLFFFSRDTAVGIEFGHGLDGRGVGVRILVRVGFFSEHHSPTGLHATRLSVELFLKVSQILPLRVTSLPCFKTHNSLSLVAVLVNIQ
jgi:hypothetical protein